MVTVVERDGLSLATGALVRPPDPREARYALARLLPPPVGVDLSQPVLLSPTALGYDPRPPVFYQGSIGSCAASASCTAAYIARVVAAVRAGHVPSAAQAAARELHPGWLYREARRRRGWQDEDTGSYAADNLDIALSGVPRLDLHPYIEDVRFEYPPSLAVDAPNQDYVLSHRPFYPTEGPLAPRIWQALAEGWPVVLSMTWYPEFFSPVRGWLPSGVPRRRQDGGHAVCIWGSVPGGVVKAGSWSAGWSADGPQAGYDLRPGDAIIPAEYLDDGTVWEARAVVCEPVPAPAPAPNPEPEPEPADEVEEFMELWPRRPGGGYDSPFAVPAALGDALARLPHGGAGVLKRQRADGSQTVLSDWFEVRP